MQATLRSLHEATDYLSQALADLLGVNRTDFRCLQILGLHGPKTAGQLAEDSGLTTGAVTTVLDRLERGNFARRVRDTVDRRRVLVELTPEAREHMQALYTDLVVASATMMADYSDDDLHRFREFLTRGAAITREHAEWARAQRAELGTQPDATKAAGPA